MGTGAQLLELFNTQLNRDQPFKTLQNAAEALEQEIGEGALMTLLKERFDVANVTQDMVDILKFPWDVVYTTNYDNAIELAAQSAGRKHVGINNSDDPAARVAGLPIIHLHGFAERWDIRSFADSCVLIGESYLRLTRVQAWLKHLRNAIDRADFVAFVGFSAEDFHINQVIYNITGLREKAVFINRPQAEKDPDSEASQRRLGVPFYFGREGFAKDIKTILASEPPKEPHLASFRRFTPPEAAPEVPEADKIEDFFIFGRTEPAQLTRDIGAGLSDFHIARDVVASVLGEIAEGARIILVTGATCDGKTLALIDLLIKLATERPAYLLQQHYDTLLNEVAEILQYAPNATLAMENCFDLPPERLNSVAAQFDGKDRVLLLTSRDISSEASGAGLAILHSFDTFRHIPIGPLSEHEADTLADLIDRFAGWRHFYSGAPGAKRNYILRSCEASLPNVLLRLLNSEYVANRYRQEFSKLSLEGLDRETVILALYLAHIGEGVPVAFLSALLEADVGAIVDRMNHNAETQGFLLLRRMGGTLETVPSIGARNILRNLFDDRELVDVISANLVKLAQAYPRTDFENKIFNQMMRYSILSGVVRQRDQINRFFDSNTTLEPIRRMPLFWLQWHMAKVEEGEFLTAEKYLEQGYKEADEHDKRTGRKWNRRQLDDRRAKFLMTRAIAGQRTGPELLRDFRDALQLTGKLLQDHDLTHHPYETMDEISRALEARHAELQPDQRSAVLSGLGGLLTKAHARLGIVAEGHQRRVAASRVVNVEQRLVGFKTRD